MNNTMTYEEEAQDSLGYFLAGHRAPTGTYREMQTGREIRMEEADILPATCDGHVAVYVRRPSTWAERDSIIKEHPLMPNLSLCCESCAHAGVDTLADYVYETEEASLRGPMLGDPDCWPPNVEGRRSLCRKHYAGLPPDSRVDYNHVWSCGGQSTE